MDREMFEPEKDVSKSIMLKITSKAYEIEEIDKDLLALYCYETSASANKPESDKIAWKIL